MDAITKERLRGFNHALDSAFVRGFVISIGVALVIVPLIVWILQIAKRVSAERSKELWARYKSWLVFIPLIVGPILLGAAWTIAAVALMSLVCYREFARAIGMFRDRS